MTEAEIANLKRQTTYELMLQNPEPILVDLGIEYKQMSNDSYKMNIRGENTPSAFISIRNGLWKYKDFGSGSNGNIINVVMDATGRGFKDSLNYCLQTLNLRNYLDEALNRKSSKIEIDRNKIKEKYKGNIEKQKSGQITRSRITGVYDIKTNDLAKDYLKGRGIVKIPDCLKVISGEYKNRQGEIKKIFGVGIKTISGGADIHFLHKIGDLKTFQIGEKDISFIKEENSKKVAVFESKMDYAVAFQEFNLDRVNVIIANSTTNSKKVAELLKKEELNKEVMFFNQNDLPGYEFVKNVIENANVKDFKTIKYESNEYKKDINDLILQDVRLKNRIEIGNLINIDKNIDKFEKISKQNVNISRGEMRRDTKQIQNINTRGVER